MIDIAHKIAFAIVKKSKEPFDISAFPNYEQRRLREKRLIKKVPKDIKCISFGKYGEYIELEDNPKDKVILYIHGGGFVSGSAEMKRDFTFYLAKKVGYNVFSANYSLAPENPFPKPLEDCYEIYKMLLTEYQANNIYLLGESAGGNLVISTILLAKQRNLQMPMGCVLISPTVQYVDMLPSYFKNEKSDCMLDRTFIDEVRATYLKKETDYVNPLISPLYADYTGFPKSLIICSDSEFLFDDSKLLHKKMLSFDCESDIKVYSNMMHAFAIIPSFKNSRSAIDEMKKFINKR